MKKLLVASVSVVAMCYGAAAADLKMPPLAAKAPAFTPVLTWQGLYIDGYFQYGANVTGVTTIAATNPAVDLASAPRGPGVGGSLGYNIDLGTWVLGLRGDISYLNVSGSGASVADSLSVSNATNYLGNLDLLVGLPLSSDRRLLAYGVGGFGFGGAKPNLQVGSIQAAASDTSTGWNVGAGLRYKLDEHLGLFIEGDYYRLGDKSLTATLSDGTVLATASAKYHFVTQKAGVTWSF